MSGYPLLGRAVSKENQALLLRFRFCINSEGLNIAVDEV
jgi:hypothetical protein